MSFRHHCSIIQNNFTALNNPLCFTYLIPFRPKPPTTKDMFNDAVTLPFPECHTIGSIQFIDFSDWLFSLSLMHLGFNHVFLWLDSFSFYHWIKFHDMDVPRFVFPFTKMKGCICCIQFWQLCRYLCGYNQLSNYLGVQLLDYMVC